MKQPYRNILTAIIALFVSLQATGQVNPANNFPDGSTLNPGTVTYPGLNDLSQPSNFNYVRTSVPDVPSANLNASYTRSSTTYLDGLGRPLQTVTKQAIDQYGDLVQHYTYDSAGRQSFGYLPYRYDLSGTILSIAAGKFHREAKTNLSDFYSGSPGEHPYGKTEYENSALARPTKVLAPGKNYVGSSRGIIENLGTNGQWTYTQGNPPTGVGITSGYPRWSIATAAGAIPQYMGNYPLGQLMRAKSQDEDGKITETFSDNLGRVVFTRSLLNTANAANPKPLDYAYTCYVYDTLGRLRCVIPPAASMTEILGSAQVSWNMDVQRLNAWCYQYNYDERNRKIEQRLPGKGWESFVYDKRDRMVMYQDSNLRAANKWQFKIHDGYDRLLVTGIYYQDSPLPRITLQGNINDGYGFAPLASYLNNYQLFNDYPAVLTGCTFLTYTFYDNYSNAVTLPFDPSQFDNIGLPSEGTVVPSVLDTVGRGLVTGTRVRVLDPDNPAGNTWITSAVYYDKRGRVIQTKTTNLNGGIDISSNVYYFQGMLWKNILHKENPTAKAIAGSDDGAHTSYQIVTTSVANLHSGGGSDQVKSLSVNIDGNFEYPLANYFYDHLGRVVAKQTPAANVLNEYNVRGQLTHIDAENTNNAPDSVHLFEENLYYDWGFASKLYNGRLAGITWRMAGSAADTQAYGYTYDGLSRLNHAEYRRKTGPNGWVNSGFNYTASNITYDYNGNLKTMTQVGPVNGSPATMDQLVYTYGTGGNQLTKLEDAIPAATTASLPDFKNNVNVPIEYAYDGNGNLTVDANKKISSVTYNHLNKPEVITIQGQGTITYTYDALGSRLREKVHTNATNSDDVYDYLDNFVYKNDTLQFILNNEGRARPIVNDLHDTRFVYDYFIRDHLGNVRSTVTAEPMNQAYLASHEIAMAGTEQLVFDNIPNVRDIKPGGGGSDAMAIRLNGGEADKRIGTAIMLKVMPGDRFTVSADVFYDGSYQQSTEEVGSDAIVQSLAAALTGGTTYSGVPVSELPANARIAGSLLNDPNLATSLASLVDQTNNPDAPKAHLNILYFDESFRLNPKVSSVTQVNPNLLGGNGWNILTPTGGNSGGSPLCCVMPGSGYVVIYVDNQSVGKDVWFDNIMVGHYTGKVQEENHYYPYGLTLQTDAQVNHKDQPYKYNGISLEKHLGLEMFETRYRSLGLDPQRGQFTQVDPKSELMFGLSPYASMGNNPSNFADPLGDEQVNYNDVTDENFNKFNVGRDNLLLFEVSIFANPKKKSEADYGWLNIAQAAQQDIGRNDYNRWRVNTMENTVLGQMAIGVAPLVAVIGIEAVPLAFWSTTTSVLSNPVAWTEGAGAVMMGAAGYDAELPSAGTVSVVENAATRTESRVWEVGAYNELRGVETGLDAHHVGQKALMKKFIPEYNANTAPSILVPKLGHTQGVGVVSRNTKGFTNARQVIARDIFELRRVYGNRGIPNSALERLIQMNKEMYPSAFIKQAQ